MIRRKLLITNLLVILLTIGILTLAVVESIRVLFYRENSAIYDSDISSMYSSLNTMFQNGQDDLLKICVDSSLQSALKSSSLMSQPEEFTALCSRLEDYTGSNTTVTVEPIVDGLVYRVNGGAFTVSADTAATDPDYSYHWQFQPNGKEVVRVWRYVLDNSDINRKLAIAQLDLPISSWSADFYTFGTVIGKKATLYLLDDQDNYLIPFGTSGKMKLSDSQLNSLSNASYSLKNASITVVKNFNQSHWKMVVIFSGASLLTDSEEIIQMIYRAGAGLAILGFALTYFSTRHITAPITDLAEKMPSGRNVEVYERLTIPRNAAGEVRTLYENYNALIDTINASLKRVQEVTQRQADDKIMLLQTQINPHFLYNTLNTVNWLAESGKTEEIQEVNIALVDLFRYNVNNGSIYCTVRQDIDHLKDYFTIMKYRYPDKYSVEYEIDSAAEDLWITKQILQPLAENALVHGFAAMDHPGIIRVYAHVQEDQLVMGIWNDGNPADIAMIGRLIDGDPSVSPGHFGIRNVNDRLTSYYGAGCGLHYAIAQDGTDVSFRLPIAKLRKKGNTENV